MENILREEVENFLREEVENIQREEVVAAVRNLKKRKAPGEDNITADEQK